MDGLIVTTYLYVAAYILLFFLLQRQVPLPMPAGTRAFKY